MKEKTKHVNNKDIKRIIVRHLEFFAKYGDRCELESFLTPIKSRYITKDILIIGLFNAVQVDNLENLQYFLERIGNIECICPKGQIGQGYTPLLWAARYAAVKCARFLINNGANVNARVVSKEKDWPVVFEALNSLTILKLVLKKKADINATLKNGNGILHHMWSYNNYNLMPLRRFESMFNLFREYKLNPLIKNNKNVTPLEMFEEEKRYWNGIEHDKQRALYNFTRTYDKEYRELHSLNEKSDEER